jgi:hypothetical protein
LRFERAGDEFVRLRIKRSLARDEHEVAR